ncbi:DUF2306 domain-containing protein [uncultured Tateyamaria sp.]|uniref:DUF2306 domain-containing protein n=1 Tax=uncultured Tateyamaria sp. TaxID=455651 RepID=UPI003439C8D9
MTPAIWVHLGAVTVALLLGAFVLLRPKGTRSHRIAGRLWVGLMVVGAVSSFFISELFNGGPSPIHLLSVWTLISVFLGLRAIRQRPRRMQVHGAHMQSLYAAGLLIAGGFTFLPQRLLGQLTFGPSMPIANCVYCGNGVCWSRRHGPGRTAEVVNQRCGMPRFPTASAVPRSDRNAFTCAFDVK